MPVASASQNYRVMGESISATSARLTSTRWSSVAVAMVLAACAHSPQAAVQGNGGDFSRDLASAAPTSASVCVSDASSRASLQSLTTELKAQGMALKTACQSGGRSLQVQLQVVDGMKASRVVRGPLADGEEVDMGTPSGVMLAGAALDAHGFSPDVLHNRVWLSQLMARHQFENQPDAWWLFSKSRAVAPEVSETDLASR